MAISGAAEIYKKISSQIDSQFPGFIREEGPRFVAFLKAYYEYLEQSGNAGDAIRSISDNQDIDRTVDSFVEYFRGEFLINIPQNVLADKRLLTKHIRQFYRSRGSQESFRFLFRALFNKEIEFYYPGDDILRVSDGRWTKESKLRVSAPFSGSPHSLEGWKITGFTSGATAVVEEVLSTIASGITVFDLILTNIVGVFADAERVSNADGTYATVNSTVGPITSISILDGGAFHNRGDEIEINDASSTQVAKGIVTKTSDRSGVVIKLIKGGSGYTKENTTLIVTGGNGTGFKANVHSYSVATTSTQFNTDRISSLKNVQLNANSFFVRRGANTSVVATKLTGTVKLATGSNNIIGQGTAFTTQLVVGNLVRVTGHANTLRVHSISSAQTFVAVFRPVTNQATGANAYIKLAGANVYTTLAHALKFSNTASYSINAIVINNPGKNYSTLPSITIVDTDIGSLNYDDGYSGTQGHNAVVTSNNAFGTIVEMTVRDVGEGFNRNEISNLVNLTQGISEITSTNIGSTLSGNTITKYLKTTTTFGGTATPQPRGLTIYPGKYIDTKGFLSWNNKLQDNFYYQEFSYEIRVSELVDKYRDVIKAVLHPAGTKMFGKYKIGSTATMPTTFASSLSSILGMYINESVTATDIQIGGLVYTANTAESFTASESNVGVAEYPGDSSESFTSTEVEDATVVFAADSAESITSTEVQDTTVVFAPSSAETITVSTVDVGIRFTPMLNVYVRVQYANNVIQGYATLQIAPYANIPIGAFDGNPRLVTNTAGSALFANGALRANTGTISVGGPGSYVLIIPVSGSNTTQYQVNTIFSNTAFTLRTNYIPVTSNAAIKFVI